MSALKERLGKELLIIDGALGTQLQAAGLPAGEAPMLWSITHPDVVEALHRAYLEAGAELITTNTFGANALTLAEAPYSVEEVVCAGVACARKAIEAYLLASKEEGRGGGTARPRPYLALDIAPLGQLLSPLGALAFSEAVALFREQVSLGVKAGVDCILIETMLDTYELKAAILAAREASDLPLLATVALNEQGRMLNGAQVDGVAVLMEGLGVDALGLNCGAGPSELAQYVKKLSELCSVPIIFSPNAGKPQQVDGVLSYPTSPQEFAAQMEPLLGEQIALAGGCCGTTPEHIKALAKAAKNRAPVISILAKSAKRRVSSSAAVVELGVGGAAIDYRIDPATNAALAAALAEEDYEALADEALDAQCEGADIIAVRVRTEQVDEVVALAAAVQEIQALVSVPLLLISSTVAALEAALFVYNGCPLVALAHLEKQDYEAVRALAACYGAVIQETAL